MTDDAMLRFTYRLARQLGYTVRDLTGSMGWDEFLTWIAFEELEPADQAADIRAAKLAYYAGNAGRFKDALPMERILPHFGIGEPPSGVQTLGGAVSIIEMFGSTMPDDIKARFK